MSPHVSDRWLVFWLFEWFVSWFNGWLFGWFLVLVGYLVGRLVGYLVVGFLVGWSVNFLVGWLVVWLVGWMENLDGGWVSSPQKTPSTLGIGFEPGIFLTFFTNAERAFSTFLYICQGTMHGSQWKKLVYLGGRYQWVSTIWCGPK